MSTEWSKLDAHGTLKHLGSPLSQLSHSFAHTHILYVGYSPHTTKMYIEHTGLTTYRVAPSPPHTFRVFSRADLTSRRARWPGGLVDGRVMVRLGTHE